MAFLDEFTPPQFEVFPPQSEASWASAGRPEFQSVNAQLFERGLQQDSHVECNLGAEVGRVFPKP